jgi:acyl carrier protein
MTDILGSVGELHEKIKDIITEELELEPDELNESGSFIEDYDADSLSLITIVSRIEKELGVVVPKDELPNMSTLGNVYLVVGKYAGVEAASE